jgi:hypothetical protein
MEGTDKDKYSSLLMAVKVQVDGDEISKSVFEASLLFYEQS